VFKKSNQKHAMTSIQNFTTNINCGSCVRSVTPFLDEVEGVTIWRVDVEDDRKVLSVEGSASTNDIIKMVEEAGFDITPM
jgi:copper chaperone CopZ